MFLFSFSSFRRDCICVRWRGRVERLLFSIPLFSFKADEHVVWYEGDLLYYSEETVTPVI